MQSSFRKPYQIIERSQGRYEKGKWVDGEEISRTILASVQPLNQTEMDKLVAAMQGRHIQSAVKVYTDEKLTVAGENEHNGTVILFNDERYEVVARASYQSGVINHYRYMARRVK